MQNKSIIYFAFLFLYLAKPLDSEELLKELLEEVSRLSLGIVLLISLPSRFSKLLIEPFIWLRTSIISEACFLDSTSIFPNLYSIWPFFLRENYNLVSELVKYIGIFTFSFLSLESCVTIFLGLYWGWGIVWLEYVVLGLELLLIFNI